MIKCPIAAIRKMMPVSGERDIMMPLSGKSQLNDEHFEHQISRKIIKTPDQVQNLRFHNPSNKSALGNLGAHFSNPSDFFFLLIRPPISMFLSPCFLAHLSLFSHPVYLSLPLFVYLYLSLLSLSLSTLCKKYSLISL